MKKKVTVPSDYKIVFSEEFFGDGLIEERWLPQQPWGRIHFGDPHQYYESNNVVVNNGLKL